MGATGSRTDATGFDPVALREAFDRALDCPPERRQQWLRDNVGDARLRERVARRSRISRKIAAMRTNVDLIVDATWALPIAPENRVLPGHSVAVSAGRIMAFGARAAAACPP